MIRCVYRAGYVGLTMFSLLICIPGFNGDVSGPGVRASFYVQSVSLGTR
jgi:hypothetical protein